MESFIVLTKKSAEKEEEAQKHLQKMKFLKIL